MTIVTNDAVLAERQDGVELSPRQQEIADLLATHCWPNKQLARHLGVSEGTIKQHLHTIYEKLGITGRLELMRYVGRQALGGGA